MYTQCPECLSVFSIGAQALAQAHGYVECGHCGTGFDSLATISEQLPPEPFRELAANAQALTPPRIELVVYRPQEAAPEPVVVASSTAAPARAAEDFSQLVFTPRFARSTRKPERERKPRRDKPRHARGAWREAERARHWPWAIVCLALALALAAQLAWIGRDSLIRNSLTGSWLRGACATFGCSLPLVPAPRQLHLLASNVQIHPNAAHALMISLSLRNDAAFAQPWPVVVVTLEDAHGRHLAMRRLRPGDYLDDDDILKHGLAPGATTALLLEVEDPGEQAVAYEFSFE